MTHPDDDPSRLVCAEEGPLGCLRWDVEKDPQEQEEENLGPLGPGPGIGSIYDPTVPGSTINDQGIKTTLCGWGNDTSQTVIDENCDCATYSGPCSEGQCVRQDVQLAVGFIGSAKTDEKGPKVVADLRPICGPWTGAPYTENWRHLKVEGPTYGYGDHTVNPSTARPMLHEALIEMSEMRGVQVRPASMKMCPPNYLPDMITIRVLEEEVDENTTNTYVASLDTLRCIRARPIEEETDELVFVRLHDMEWNQAEEVYGLTHYAGYTVAGEPFRLEQRIGYPNEARINQLEPQDRSCAPGVIRGLSREYDSSGRLKDVSVECVPRPQL